MNECYFPGVDHIMRAASRWKWGGLAALCIGCAGIWWGLQARPQAPNVQFIALDGSGSVTMQDLRGRVVIVNFWATSCTTCVKEMPEMVATYQKYKDRGLAFVAVAMQYDIPEYVAGFAVSRQLPFMIMHDRQASVAKAFGDIQLTPTTFVIDQAGHILRRYTGEPDFTQLHDLLEKTVAPASV